MFSRVLYIFFCFTWFFPPYCRAQGCFPCAPLSPLLCHLPPLPPFSSGVFQFCVHEVQTRTRALPADRDLVIEVLFHQKRIDPWACALRMTKCICNRCTKRSGLSVYFCMRDWVRTLQFKSRFKRNTTRINHLRYLKDREAERASFMWCFRTCITHYGAHSALDWLDG